MNLTEGFFSTLRFSTFFPWLNGFWYFLLPSLTILVLNHLQQSGCVDWQNKPFPWTTWRFIWCEWSRGSICFQCFLSDALSRESSKEIKNALLLHYTRCKYKEISYPSTTEHIFNIGFFLYNTLLDFLGGRSIIKFCSFSQIRIIFLKIGNLKKEGGKWREKHLEASMELGKHCLYTKVIVYASWHQTILIFLFFGFLLSFVFKFLQSNCVSKKCRSSFRQYMMSTGSCSLLTL